MRDATGVVPPATFDEAVKRAYKFKDINNQSIRDRKQHHHQQNQRQQNKSQGKTKIKQGKIVVTMARTMKGLNVIRPQVLAFGVGLWTMPSEIAHNYRIKAIETSSKDKQPPRISHQLKIRQGSLNTNNSKANNKFRIRMLVLHSSKTSHSNRDGHTTLIV